MIKTRYCKASKLSTFIIIQLIYIVVRHTIGGTSNWYISGITVLISVLIDVIVLGYCIAKTKRQPLSPYVYAVIAFQGYMTIGHMIKGDYTVHIANDFLLLFFCLLCVLDISTDDFIERAYRFCLFMLIASIVYSMTSYVYMIACGIYSPGTRMPGIAKNPNTFGAMAAFGFSIGLGTIVLKPARTHLWILNVINAILTLFVLIDSQSRASLLFTGISVVGFIVCFMQYWRKTLPTHTIKIISCFFLILIVLFFVFCLAFITNTDIRMAVLHLLRIPAQPDSSLTEIFDNTIAAFQDASHRGDIRQSALDSWKDNIWFGVSSIDIVDEIKADFSLGFSARDGSHNSFIQFLATLGIVGFALFLIYYGAGLIGLIYCLVKSQDTRMKTIASFFLVLFIAMSAYACYENVLYPNTWQMTFCSHFIIITGFHTAHLTRMEKKAVQGGGICERDQYGQ